MLVLMLIAHPCHLLVWSWYRSSLPDHSSRNSVQAFSLKWRYRTNCWLPRLLERLFSGSPAALRRLLIGKSRPFSASLSIQLYTSLVLTLLKPLEVLKSWRQSTAVLSSAVSPSAVSTRMSLRLLISVSGCSMCSWALPLVVIADITVG